MGIYLFNIDSYRYDTYKYILIQVLYMYIMRCIFTYNPFHISMIDDHSHIDRYRYEYAIRYNELT